MTLILSGFILLARRNAQKLIQNLLRFSTELRESLRECYVNHQLILHLITREKLENKLSSNRPMRFLKKESFSTNIGVEIGFVQA